MTAVPLLPRLYTASLRTLALAAFFGAWGCNTQLSLDECNGAPAAPSASRGLDEGEGVVEGYDGSFRLPARLRSGARGESVVLGATEGTLLQVYVGAFDLDTLAAGGVYRVGVSYGTSTGGGEGGLGQMHIVRADARSVEGTFAGCVRRENTALGFDGPRWIVRGGFNAIRE